jgi:SPP1 gp7 family putative phage head morphogenesis protein
MSNVADDYLQRQILTQRYMSALTRKYSAQLIQMNDMVANMITKAGSTRRLEEIRRDLEFAIGESLVKFNKDFTEDMEGLAEQELDFVSKTINANSKVLLQVPNFDSIFEAIMKSPMDLDLTGSRLTLGQALLEFSEGKADEIRQVIFDGIVTGQTNRDMANGIQDLSSLRSRAQVDALTRTLSNHTTAQTRKGFAEEYRNVFDGEEFLATLDSRTTLECAGADGKIFPVGQGLYPPLHWGCRSLRVPVMKASYDAQTNKSNREDFDSWLRDQPAGFQDEYFSGEKGMVRKELFQKGDLKIEKFTDDSGREYSLKELRMLYGESFKKADITNFG